MGMWGPGLYDDDTAADLRDAVALVAKVPGTGERLLTILRDMNGLVDADDIDGQTFWLVLADQFERRAISCAEVTAKALSIIVDGRNLSCLKDLGAEERLLAKRAKVLDGLAERLRSPRPYELRSAPKTPPAMILEAGEVYAFPAMNGASCHPYRLPYEGPFVANGWGALVVLETGRAFDWLPWCALASLTVDPERKPTLPDAVSERLIFHLQTEGAARCIPKRSHIRTMSLELLGSVLLDPVKVRPVISKWSVLSAIECGWSVAYTGYTRNVQGLPTGGYLSELVINAS
jgi:hypothetical protein